VIVDAIRHEPGCSMATGSSQALLERVNKELRPIPVIVMSG
jgi:hypothetical protein